MAKPPKPPSLETAIAAYFSAIGRMGGLASAKKKTKAERVAQARRAISARWAKAKKTTKESD
jgi:hypothetical protein